MATIDFSFNPSAALTPQEPYDGRDYGIEMAAMPKARARGYSSVGDNHQDSKLLVDNDSKPLQSHPGLSGVPTSKSNREKRRKLQGWRFGVACSAWVAFTVLMMNVILTIYAGARFKADDGVGTAYHGSCEVVNSWTTWLHILINALSSILLSASNYTMQCLCSPTRAEIDKAHAKGDWLDVGVASVRNILGRIRPMRQMLWWALALSSIPIHLLYNSAIFKSLGQS